MIWLTEEHLFSENVKRLKRASAKCGTKHHILRLDIPDRNIIIDGTDLAENNRLFNGDSIYKHEPFFFYGSLETCKWIQRNKIKIVTFCNFKQFECSYYYPRLENHLFQQDYAFVPFYELTKRKQWILKSVGYWNKVFCRPNSGDKSFTGQVISKNTWDEDIKNLAFYGIEPETLCLIAKPQVIKNEYRFVIGNHYPYDEFAQFIVTGSSYSWGKKKPKQVMSDHPAWEYAQTVLREINYRPDPFWTMDIVEDREGQFKVLEVGSMSCSGVYNCNVDLIVESISKYLTEEWKENSVENAYIKC